MIWILVLIFIIGDAYWNHLRIDKGYRINHIWNAAYRIVFYGLLVYLYRMPYLQNLWTILEPIRCLTGLRENYRG